MGPWLSGVVALPTACFCSLTEGKIDDLSRLRDRQVSCTFPEVVCLLMRRSMPTARLNTASLLETKRIGKYGVRLSWHAMCFRWNYVQGPERMA